MGEGGVVWYSMLKYAGFQGNVLSDNCMTTCFSLYLPTWSLLQKGEGHSPPINCFEVSSTWGLICVIWYGLRFPEWGPLILYSGKLSRDKTFVNWWKKKQFSRKKPSQTLPRQKMPRSQISQRKLLWTATNRKIRKVFHYMVVNFPAWGSLIIKSWLWSSLNVKLLVRGSSTF